MNSAAAAALLDVISGVQNDVQKHTHEFTHFFLWPFYAYQDCLNMLFPEQALFSSKRNEMG
jgi:hypothetical protein